MEPPGRTPFSQRIRTVFALGLLLTFLFSSGLASRGNSVLAWGSGLGTNVPSLLTNANVNSIAAGSAHGLALLADGAVVGWGANFDGQASNAPPDLTNVVAVGTGFYHSLAVRANGVPAAWGSNGEGQSAVPGDLSNVVAVAGGTYHSLALRRDGTVTNWGRYWDGGINIVMPLASDLTNVVAIAAGDNHDLFLRTNRTVTASGLNNFGQTDVPTWLTNVTAIAAGGDVGLALVADGTVVAWGRNDSQQTNVPPQATNVVAIAAGPEQCLALRRDGTVVAWGRNLWGQTSVPAGLSNVVAIACGQEASYALVGAGEFEPFATCMNPCYSDSKFSVTVATVQGRNYQLEFKDSLLESYWRTALVAAPGDGAARRLTDPAASAPRRFYRVRQW